MQNIHRQTLIGLGAILVALFLILYAIPTWVSAPSNVRKLILSPLFWPYALAVLTILIGLGLIFTGMRSEEDLDPDRPDVPGGGRRLLMMAAIMVLTMFLMPRIGMVWTSMAAFAATAFLVQTRHPKTAIICAVAIPLVLYAFFAHVAGVAIPQGEFVRLP
jgi:hypothetical protein